MPSSISTVRWLALPSSSTLSEPRRSAMVPSSSTVTPLAATRLPMRPENALEPLRDRFVQKDAGPAGAEHHGHFAGGRRARIEIRERSTNGIVDVGLDL